MFAIIIAAALAGASQASPPAQDVACVSDRLPPGARAGIVQEAQTGQGGPVRDALNEAGRACAAERSWTPEHSGRVTMAAGVSILREEASRRLERNGIAVAPIDSWFAAQRPAVRTNSNMASETVAALLTSLQAQGLSEQLLNAHAGDIGLYVAARVISEQMRTGRAR